MPRPPAGGNLLKSASAEEKGLAPVRSDSELKGLQRDPGRPGRCDLRPWETVTCQWPGPVTVYSVESLSERHCPAARAFTVGLVMTMATVGPGP